MEVTPQGTKKGMSKGCLIALSVTVLAVVLIGLAIFIYWQDLVKFSLNTAVEKVQIQLSEQPLEGIDSVMFNSIADQFQERLSNEEALDMRRYQAFAEALQTTVQNPDSITVDMVNGLTRGMIAYYPELAEQFPDIVIPDDFGSGEPATGDPVTGEPATDDSGSNDSGSEDRDPDAFGADESATDY